MATFALRPQLTPVNVHVATHTLRRGLGKHQILMTLFARDIRVLIAKRKARAIVIKQQRRTNLIPRCRGVAPHACDLQIPMRRGLTNGDGCPQDDQYQQRHRDANVFHHDAICGFTLKKTVKDRTSAPV